MTDDPGTFTVDTDGLNGAIPIVNKLKETLEGIHRNLYAELEATNMLPTSPAPAWGTGATGRAFAESYVGPAGSVMAAAEQGATAVGKITAGLGDLVDGFDSTEDVNKGAAVFE